MKMVYLIIFFSVFLMSVNQSFGDENQTELVYAKILNDRSACEDSVPVFVSAPESVDGHEFWSAAFFLKDGDRVFNSSLTYRDDLDEDGGIFFCLDKLSLEHARVVINYGYDNCKGFIHSFWLEGFDKILTKKKVFPRQRKAP